MNKVLILAFFLGLVVCIAEGGDNSSSIESIESIEVDDIESIEVDDSDSIEDDIKSIEVDDSESIEVNSESIEDDNSDSSGDDEGTSSAAPVTAARRKRAIRFL
jgi:hypothetical protein